MKLRDLVRHLTQNGCVIIRDKGPHTVWRNTKNGKFTTVPRHREINDFLAKKICKKDLEIPEL